MNVLARPVMGTIFLVIFTRSRNTTTGDNSMYCMIPDPFSTAFGKGSATPDYYTYPHPRVQIRARKFIAYDDEGGLSWQNIGYDLSHFFYWEPFF